MPRIRSRSNYIAPVLVVCVASVAHAEPPEPGTWRAGATSTEVVVGSWGPDCGAPPRSTKSAGGGTVQLRREGTAIVLEAGGRTIRSNQCWSQNPGVRRVANTEQAGVWTTTCATAANDPREEHGSYTLRLLPDGHLLYQDSSRYDWKLQKSSCAATATTTQTLARVADAVARVAPPPSTPASATATAPAPACQPGAAARIALRPPRASIEVGQRACFRPLVTDAAGCALPEPAVRWSLEHAAQVKGRIEDGCFIAGDQAAEAEGEFRVIVALGALRADAPVTVTTPDLSSLLARRIETGALQGEAAPPEQPPAPGTPTQSVAKVAAKAAPPPRLGAPAVPPVAIVAGGLALVLAIAIWLVMSRRRRASDAVKEAIRASQRPPAPAPATGAPSAAPEEPWICPTCRVGYPRASGTCPKDGATLVPYRQFAEARRSLQPAAGKRCPRCGKVYGETAAFCSEDGTPLG